MKYISGNATANFITATLNTKSEPWVQLYLDASSVKDTFKSFSATAKICKNNDHTFFINGK